MKCSCDAERSFNSEARHLVINWLGVMASSTVVSYFRTSAVSNRPEAPAADI